MKKEKLQLTAQKYKGTYETTTSNSMPIIRTTQKKFSERQNLPKLNQEEIENMNKPITSSEIETPI